MFDLADFGFVTGEQVTVERPVPGDTDVFGDVAAESWDSETVDNVLVVPGPRSDVSDDQRPHGVRVVWNLHFPKGYPATLRGARVKVRGGDPLYVIGDPQHYMEANTPGAWSMPVEVASAKG